jgi:predicted nucleic acid-binding protein
MSHRLFFDSSALYAAAYSSTGAARELIRWSLHGKVQTIISQDVLDEIQRNITRKAPDVVGVYRLFLSLLSIEVVPDPTKTEVREAEQFVTQKDAPIVAAAKKAKIDYLVTFDKKHLLRQTGLAIYIGAEIVTPKEVLVLLRPTSPKRTHPDPSPRMWRGESCVLCSRGEVIRPIRRLISPLLSPHQPSKRIRFRNEQPPFSLTFHPRRLPIVVF